MTGGSGSFDDIPGMHHRETNYLLARYVKALQGSVHKRCYAPEDGANACVGI